MATRSQVGNRGGLPLDSIEDSLRAHTDDLLKVAHGILRDPSEAEDAVQDALVLAWRKWDQVRDPDHRRAWLMAICVRRCLELRPTLLRRHASAGSEGALAEVVAPQEEQWSDWDAALARLSAKQRAVIVLHYRHGYTLDECAGLMGSRPGSTRQHLARALARLRKEIDHA